MHDKASGDISESFEQKDVNKLKKSSPKGDGYTVGLIETGPERDIFKEEQIMLMPSIFGENLFDDFMNDFSFPAGRSFFGMPSQNVMKTDIKETDNDYELKIELPGYKKEDVKAQLKDGYLTVSASTEKNNDEKDENGKFLRKERYTGSASRSFYVGENVTEDDIHAKFDNGVLTLSFPKEAPKKVEEQKYISIEG